MPLPRRSGSAALVLAWGALSACAALRTAPPPVTSPAPAPAPAPALRYAPAGAPVELASGVRVWVAPDRDAALVHLALRLEVGSRHETAARAGLAHLTGHALLELRPGGGASLAQRLSAAALAHAFTITPDATIVQVTSLPDGLPAVLAVFADLLRGECSGLSTASFAAAQRGALAEARDPTASGLLAGLYGPEHPYGHAPDGTGKTLAALTRNDLCAFYLGQYTPSRASLAVTGAVSPAAFTGAVAPLAALPRRELGGPPVEAPRWTGAGAHRGVQLYVGGPFVALALPLPPRFAADAASGELFAVAVELRLRELQRDSLGPPLRALTTGGAQTPLLLLLAGHDGSAAAHASALARLWRAVDEAPQLAADATLFHVARQQRTAAALLPFTAADQRGLQLTAYLAAPSTPASLTDELAQLAAQTPERLVQLAQDRLGRNQALELSLSPPPRLEVLPERSPALLPLRSEHGWRVDADAGELPGLAALAPSAAPAPRRERLANGLELVLQPLGDVPVVELRLVMAVGLDHGDDQFPLAPALAPLLAAGDLATLGSAVDVASPAGAPIEVEVGRRSTVFAVRGLTTDLDPLLAALQRELQFTDYSDTTPALQEMRRRRRAEVGPLRDLAARLAARTGKPCIDGPDLDARDTIYTGKQLRRFKTDHYRADRATLIVTGNFDPTQVQARAQQVFAAARGVESWNLASAPAQPQSHERGLLGRAREPQIVAAPGDPRVAVTLAYSISDTLRAAPAALATVEALAEQAAQRVGLHAGRRRVCGHELLLITGTAAPADAEPALRTLQRELELLRGGAELARPLARARRLAVRTLLTGADQPQAVAARLVEAHHDGTSLDLRSLAAQVARISAADLRGHLADVLDPARSELVCRGPATAAHAACNAVARTSAADPFAPR